MLKVTADNCEDTKDFPFCRRVNVVLSRLLFASAMVAFATVDASAQGREVARPIVIRDVTVISPERAQPLEHAYVRLENGRIADISQAPLKGGQEVDGRGRYLVPGLIDSHVHLRWISAMRPEDQRAHPNLVAAANAQEPRSYLYFGFTTVLSLGATAPDILKWNALQTRPDAFFCGGTPMFEGYSFRGVDETPYFLFNPDQEEEVPASVDRTKHTPEAVVARMAADGAICVKGYFESGFGNDSNLPVPDVSTIRRVVAAAHSRNMPVFLHANGQAAQQFALRAGVDVIAHGQWNGPGLRDGKLAPETASLANDIATRRMGYQPTMQVIRGLRNLFDPQFFAEPLLPHANPPALLAWYRSEEGGWFRTSESEFFGPRADPLQIYDRVHARGAAVLTALSKQDARLLFGTDTPSSPTYANPPGLNGFLEMRNWVAAGVSLKQLLHSLTLENARILGKAEELGTVEKGKIAHLLLLREDPLKSVEAYNAIETVFLAGEPLRRETLSASRPVTSARAASGKLH